MEEFKAHGYYAVSNAGGYEVELHPSGDSARIKNGEEVTDWLEIEWVPDEDPAMDFIPVIDPKGYDVPLNMIMRI